MFILDQQSSIASQYLTEIRDEEVQKDRLRFRFNMKRLGFLLAYEISKKLTYEAKTISTPLTNTEGEILKDDLVIVSILRAAVPFAQGFQEVFDGADFGFIGAARQENNAEEGVSVNLDYLATPDLNQKVVIIVDPMLATGKSLVQSIDKLMENGKPRSLHIATAIAAPEGVNYLQDHLSTAYNLWSCALDEKLNEKYYIVPGLGDAGDLAYGQKM